MFPSLLIFANFVTVISGTPLAADYTRTFEPFSHKKKFVPLGIEPTHTMLRNGRSTHQATRIVT